MSAVEPMVAAWAEKIRTHLDAAERHAEMTVAEYVAAGHDLIAAKDAVRPGSWLRLLDSIGMSPRAAQRLMVVARHPVLSDATRVSQLPAAIGTLAILAGLVEDELTAAMEADEIGPDTTRAKAQAIVNSLRPKPPKLTKAEREAALAARGDQGEMFDPVADALDGAARQIAHAIHQKANRGITDPDRVAKALAATEECLAILRDSPDNGGVR